MAKWTAAKRKKYLEEHPENFAGPDGSYPIEDASDVGDAWGLAGHAADPDAVRTKIKSIAKRLGLESGLPDTATEDDNKERSMPTSEDDTLNRAGYTNHEPMSGKHSHAHPAFGAQGDDDTHEHEHSHDGDADHKHDHAERSADGAVIPESLSVYAPITRTDKDAWIIEGQVTSDQVDYYGTIFDYEASKQAFQTWRGNIREQHDSKKAVGRAIEVIPDDENHCIYLRARISKGARDTWEKILDGTLSGFSVNADPRHVETTNIMRDGKSIPVYRVKKWAEVSVVDNPGSPGCDVAIVRADGVLTDIIDASEEETPPAPEPQPIERAGARVSADTRASMHKGIGHTLQAAVSQMQNCGCDGCSAAMKQLDPDGDGDIDFGGYDDPDGDADSLYTDGDGDMSRSLESLVERILEQKLSPVYARLQGIAGTLARSNAAPTTALDTLIDGAITRAVEAAVTANASSLSEVRAELSAVKGTVDKIADTPVPGAPVMHASSTRPPVEKRLATDPYQAQRNSGSAVYDAIAQLSAQGQLDTLDKQVDALHAGLVAQRGG